MDTFAADSIESLRAACEAGALMAGLAFSEALGREVAFRLAPDATAQPVLTPELQGAATGLVFESSAFSSVLLIPDLPFFPDWLKHPRSLDDRLTELAKGLQVLLPDSLRPAKGWFVRMDDVGSLLADTGAREVLAHLRCELQAGTDTVSLPLLWPCPRLQELQSVVGGPPPAMRTLQYADIGEGLQLLPPYARSLLRIRVPVSVTLATTRSPVKRIVELCPGAIISFKKPCDETLTLEVGGLPVAEGEAVKVGDKFGLWITSITLPKERFRQVIGPAGPAQRTATTRS